MSEISVSVIPRPRWEDYTELSERAGIPLPDVEAPGLVIVAERTAAEDGHEAGPVALVTLDPSHLAVQVCGKVLAEANSSSPQVHDALVHKLGELSQANSWIYRRVAPPKLAS